MEERRFEPFAAAPADMGDLHDPVERRQRLGRGREDLVHRPAVSASIFGKAYLHRGREEFNANDAELWMDSYRDRAGAPR